MNESSICAIVVTYNRKELLLRCLKAILRQYLLPKSIYIIDNASTDGTFKYITDNFSFSVDIENNKLIQIGKKCDVEIYYYLMTANEGGAGGFYTGLKLSHEQNKYDAYWLMDDDGYPSDECLKRQISFLDSNDYVMPVSIDIDNHTMLSWATRKKNDKKTTIYKELIDEWGEILPFVFPFNGCLLSDKIVSEVGYINPKLFIWGDDYEHYYRCLNKGFNPITILGAIFYHPVNKAPTVPILFGKINVPYVENKMRFVCLIRNWVYINRHNHRYINLLKSFAAYTWLFLITKKFDLNNYLLYLSCVKDGFNENFDRHLKYLK